MTKVEALSSPLNVPLDEDRMRPAKSGKLIPLRTKAEVLASTETIDVYVVELPAKSASALLEYEISLSSGGVDC
jgi:hypothetical protein